MTQTTPFIEKFWFWILLLCKKKLHDSYLSRVGWDLKCPHCETWASEYGIYLMSWNDRQKRYECGHCHKVAAWEFHGPVARSVPIEYF